MKHPAVNDEDRNPENLIEDGEFSRFDLHNCCWAYLNLSIDEALHHESPLINMIAVLDKRLGKRRLTQLSINNFHPLAARLLKFRLEVEGIKNSA
jgi:hypothetical protein